MRIVLLLYYLLNRNFGRFVPAMMIIIYHSKSQSKKNSVNTAERPVFLHTSLIWIVLSGEKSHISGTIGSITIPIRDPDFSHQGDFDSKQDSQVYSF